MNLDTEIPQKGMLIRKSITVWNELESDDCLETVIDDACDLLLQLTK